MATYWLTPVVSTKPVVLGDERLRCPDSGDLTGFRDLLSNCHPRLLMMVKADSLVADDKTEAACGSPSQGAWSLADGRHIAFDGSPHALSSCGQAFFRRVPSPREASDWLRELPSVQRLTVRQREWLAWMEHWLENGYGFVLIKEEIRT